MMYLATAPIRLLPAAAVTPLVLFPPHAICCFWCPVHNRESGLGLWGLDQQLVSPCVFCTVGHKTPGTILSLIYILPLMKENPGVLGLLVEERVDVEVLQHTKSFSDTKVTSVDEQHLGRVGWTYVDPHFQKKCIPWQKFKKLTESIHESWMRIGDFNGIKERWKRGREEVTRQKGESAEFEGQLERTSDNVQGMISTNYQQSQLLG